MVAYYNEIDPYAAEWLRNLIVCDLIAHGDVDTRSIEDVTPDDLRGYTQCHFFAGIGVWSYALRQAGWSDDRPVWTGSCPCQPFSAAGKGNGFADERHLWPAFNHLISQCRPPIVIGEQVASKDAGPWIDLVQTDLEALGYAFGAVPFPSASVGAPHIRDRLYWVADAGRLGGQPDRLDVGTAEGRDEGEAQQRQRVRAESAASGVAGGLAHHHHQGPQGGAEVELRGPGRGQEGRELEQPGAAGVGGLADEYRSGRALLQREGGAGLDSRDDIEWTQFGLRPCGEAGGPGPTNGYWRDADWLFCRDGKWRPVEPGTFPLAHGAPARVGRLRAYGNAINAVQAQVFLEAVMGCRP